MIDDDDVFKRIASTPVIILQWLTWCECLSLDCESETKRFTSEWTEFTCNCQKTPGKCQMVHVADRSSKTEKKTLRVILKQDENKDPKKNDDKKELQFKLGKRLALKFKCFYLLFVCFYCIKQYFYKNHQQWKRQTKKLPIVKILSANSRNYTYY